MPDWTGFPHLAGARVRSKAVIAAVRGRLADVGEAAPELRCVAVSGSIGRLEALAHSDCDLIVVVADGTDAARGRAVTDAVWARLAPLGLPAPVATGIYVRPVTAAALLDPATRGRVADDVDVFGKRMQILLDARPVHGEGAFTALRRAVLDRYASGFLERDPAKQWSYLLNDLKRYFASYCVAKQWDFARDNGGWYVRSLKVRHSRVLMYAALLFLLGESAKLASGKPAWLAARLASTPLERLAWVYEANGDPGFARVARCYDRFLGLLGDPAARAALVRAAPACAEDLAPDRVPHYRALAENGSELMDELVRFLLARREAWGAAFFRYLLF